MRLRTVRPRFWAASLLIEEACLCGYPNQCTQCIEQVNEQERKNHNDKIEDGNTGEAQLAGNGCDAGGAEIRPVGIREYSPASTSTT